MSQILLELNIAIGVIIIIASRMVLLSAVVLLLLHFFSKSKSFFRVLMYLCVIVSLFFMSLKAKGIIAVLLCLDV